MAISHVQTVKAQGTGVTSVTTGGITTTSGNLVVLGGGDNFSAATLSVQDSKTNTWNGNPAGPLNAGGISNTEQQYASGNITGGTSHTFTLNTSGTHDLTLFASEFSMPCVANPYDKSAGQAQASNTAPTSGATGTRAQASEVLVAHFFANEANIVSVTAGTGYTVPTNGSVLSGATSSPGAIEYQVVSATGTNAGDFTLGAAPAGTVTLIGTFKENTAVGPPPCHRSQRFFRRAMWAVPAAVGLLAGGAAMAEYRKLKRRAA